MAVDKQDEIDMNQATPLIASTEVGDGDGGGGGYKELYWSGISKVVGDILNPENQSKIRFEEVYSLVYKCVCAGYSEKLRIDLIDTCIAHLHTVNHQLNQSLLIHHGPKKMVETVCGLNKALDAYLPSIQQIYSFCSYMNKLYNEETPEASLYSTLLICFCQIVCDHRLDHLMKFIEGCPPFTFAPSELLSLFTKLHMVSVGQYATVYPHLFGRYIANVRPEMCEGDLEAHLQEVAHLQAKWRATMDARAPHTGLKRPAQD